MILLSSRYEKGIQNLFRLFLLFQGLRSPLWEAINQMNHLKVTFSQKIQTLSKLADPLSSVKKQPLLINNLSVWKLIPHATDGRELFAKDASTEANSNITSKSEVSEGVAWFFS